MIEGRKQFGQVQHQKSLKISNTFPANDRVKRKKKLRGHYKARIQISISIYLHFHFFIIERKSSKNECVCGIGKKGRDPESLFQKKRDIFARSGMFRHGNLSGNHSSFNKTNHEHKKQAYFVSEDTKNRTRIVEGYEPWHRPWMTFIQIRKSSNKHRGQKSKYKCGGSIINNYWILSAGHCFCEQLKCKPSKPSKRNKGGNLRIDYKPEDHIRIINGLKDISQVFLKPQKISTPDKIFIHPL